MGIVSKSSKSSASRKAPTKLQKARRVTRIHKKVQRRTAQRVKNRRGRTVIRKGKLQKAQDEVINIIEPAYNEYPEQGQVNIMDLLNETESNPMFETLNEQLDLKLKQIDEDNLQNPQVRRVYTTIGKILSTYRSGKIPKAFKIVPNLEKWQDILGITDPSKWTPQAMFQAVNLFASNLNSDRAVVFYSKILLPSVRQNLRKNKKLNYHYFQALRKALYKPNAWFKSIMFGLETEDSTSTPREVQIIQAVIKQNSIPMLNSAAALMLLIELPYTPSRIHYIKTLIEKQYILGKKVVDTLYSYFLSFQDSENVLSVVWHQTVLSFCMFYGANFNGLQKAALKAVSQKQKHHIITAEILKYL